MESKEQNEAIWAKTLKEVRSGSMQGPLTQDEVMAMHGRSYNVVPSFGLAQGVDESGKKKFRRIDDHSACHNNAAGNRKQRIQMANVDYLMVMIKHLFQKFERDLISPLRICKAHIGKSLYATPNCGWQLQQSLIHMIQRPSCFSFMANPLEQLMLCQISIA